jgi:1-acyl-sn-glycerol-3-phosphate acyltransferase
MTPKERLSRAVCRAVNETLPGKRAQSFYHQLVGRRLVLGLTGRRLRVEGLEAAAALRPERGVLLCSNHRTFFDQFVIMAVLYRAARWPREVTFPVRSSYFHETLGGLALNGLIGGFAMYPPIHRDARRAEENKAALAALADVLARPGALVGMHPEGTRGKGPDPYDLLPAQPGTGQLIMRARPLVLPVFMNGMSNDFTREVAANFAPRLVRRPPVIIVFGPPVDFGGLLEARPRPAQYKRVADHVRAAIARLGERERELRAVADREARVG